jgi:hypothetical protein
MVKGFYEEMGFALADVDEYGNKSYKLNISEERRSRQSAIKVN